MAIDFLRDRFDFIDERHLRRIEQAEVPPVLVDGGHDFSGQFHSAPAAPAMNITQCGSCLLGPAKFEKPADFSIRVARAILESLSAVVMVLRNWGTNVLPPTISCFFISLTLPPLVNFPVVAII